jgi:hypothetical protein
LGKIAVGLHSKHVSGGGFKEMNHRGMVYSRTLKILLQR